MKNIIALSTQKLGGITIMKAQNNSTICNRCSSCGHCQDDLYDNRDVIKAVVTSSSSKVLFLRPIDKELRNELPEIRIMIR